METQNYFSQKDIKINNITRIDQIVRSRITGAVLTKPVICVFYPDGKLFALMSLTLFKIRKRKGLSIVTNDEVPGFYCELRQII